MLNSTRFGAGLLITGDRGAAATFRLPLSAKAGIHLGADLPFHSLAQPLKSSSASLIDILLALPLLRY